MTVAVPFPTDTDVFHDSRDDGRWLRVRRHTDEGIVVFSLWRGGGCTGSFQMPLADASDLAAWLTGNSMAD